MGQNDPKKGKVLGAKIAMFGECYIYCILVVVRDQELSNHVISHTPIAGNRYTNFVGGHIDLWQAQRLHARQGNSFTSWLSKELTLEQKV